MLLGAGIHGGRLWVNKGVITRIFGNISLFLRFGTEELLQVLLDYAAKDLFEDKIIGQGRMDMMGGIVCPC